MLIQLKQIGVSLPPTQDDVTKANWEYTPGRTITDSQGRTLRIPPAFSREAGEHTQTVTERGDASGGEGTPPVDQEEAKFLGGLLRKRN